MFGKAEKKHIGIWPNIIYVSSPLHKISFYAVASQLPCKALPRSCFFAIVPAYYMNFKNYCNRHFKLKKSWFVTGNN